MISHIWLRDSLAALMLLVAAASAWRLARASTLAPAGPATSPAWAPPLRLAIGEVDSDITQMLMALSMMAMLMRAPMVLPTGIWETGFALLTAWFGWKCAKDIGANGIRRLARGHHAVHCLHCMATFYMLAAPPMAPTCGSIMAMSGDMLLPLAMTLLLVGYCLRDLLPHGINRHPSSTRQDEASTIASRITMGATMAITLLAMV